MQLKNYCARLISPSARTPLDHAVTLAQSLRAEIYLLHVSQRSAGHTIAFDSSSANTEQDTVFARYLAALDEIVLRYAEHEVVINIILAEGRAWQWIINKTKEIDADMVVIGRNGRAGLSKLFVDSAVLRVVKYSPVPVLTMRM
jgi:nucleotide-binding universal stress UspA family protein